MTFKIEKNHKPPPAGPHPKYPWRELKVGESFFVPGGSIRGMSSGATLAGKRTGMKFTCRSVVNAQGKGVRIWRVK